MEKEILNKEQKTVMECVSQEPLLSHFYLTGGTALANYYLFHRLSEDLDFFTSQDIEMIFLHHFAERLKEALRAEQLRFEKLYDRNQFFFSFAGSNKELKVEFTKYPSGQIEPPLHKDNINIDSLRDIAANKLFTILDRFEPKDFIDLFFIFQIFDFEQVRRDAESKFETKIDDVFLGGELMKVKRIVALPKMIKDLSLLELNNFFENMIQKLEPQVLE